MKKITPKFIATFLTAAFIFSFNIVDCFATQATKVIKDLDKAITTPAAPAKPLEQVARPNLEYRADGLRDPFRSPIDKDEGRMNRAQAQAKKPLPAFTVQGIIWGGKLPQAIINNTVLKIGDPINGAVVNKIEPDGVTVFFDGSEYKLPSPALAPAKTDKTQGG